MAAMAEEYSINRAPLDNVDATQETPDVASLLLPGGSNAVDSPMAVDLAEHMRVNPPGTATGTRVHFKYHQLKLAAKKDFFVLQDKVDSYGESLGDDVIVKGIIDECPNKNNAYHFRVRWYPPPDILAPVGSPNESHLRVNYHRDSNKVLMQEANKLFNETFGPDASVKPATRKRRAPSSSDNNRPPPGSTPDRHQRAADVRTSASSLLFHNVTRHVQTVYGM